MPTGAERAVGENFEALSDSPSHTLASADLTRVMPQLARDVVAVLGGALGYYLCAVVGTVLSVPPSGFAIIWPATAFLISVFLITEPRQWWFCIAGVVPTHFYLAATFQAHAPLLVVLTQICGNLLLALSTVLAIRTVLGRRPVFDTFSSVLAFIGVAAVAVPALVNSAIIGTHLATGWVSDFWLAWRQWMIAVIFPTITIPLLVATAANRRLTGHATESRHPELELAVLAAGLFAATFAAYGGGVNAAQWPVLFLVPFPFLLWAAIRLGVGGTCLSLLVFAAATIIQALRHNGPFSMASPIDDVISLQTYLVTTSIPLTLLAALMDERRQADYLLRRSEARMQAVAMATDTGLWQWDCDARELWLTEHCRRMFRLPARSDLTPFSLLDGVAEKEREKMRRAIELALTSTIDPPLEEYRVEGRDGIHWLLLSMHPEVDSAGRVVRLSGSFRDVTESRNARLEANSLRSRIARLREDERRRIAEELHDSTAQHLVAAGLSLANLKTRLQLSETRTLLADAMQSLRQATHEIRTFSYLLHPPNLGRVGLSEVLRAYVPGFERRTGVHTSLRLSSVVDLLPNSQQHAIMRIAQESLGNVHRHASASNVWVSVRCFSGKVHLVVRDDGKGIDSTAGEALRDRLLLGVGIPAMAARAKRLGGRLDVNSRSTGTTIHVTIPLPDKLARTVH